MDRNAFVIPTSADDFEAADRKRLDTFSFGSVPPRAANRRSAPLLSNHARSHSRKDSSVSSIPTTVSLPQISSIDSPPTSPGITSTKRNSHHRRRSSVSTRHESAELMGVTLPHIPLSLSEDNINLGDKDSVRRRALWALEGKTDVGTYAKVEIPELGSDEAKKPFDFPSKPSFPPGIGAGFGAGLNNMGSKRDSVGKLAPSTSNTEQLGTLIEEEEEEEDTSILDVTVTSSPVEESPASVVDAVATSVPPAPVRHRPASLNLRPLSLVAGTMDLPTPSPSPNAAVSRPGLRALTLTSSPVPDSGNHPPSDATGQTDPLWKRRSAVFMPSSAPPAPTPRAAPSAIQVPPPVAPSASRRTSFSYRSVDIPVHGLPTPEMTPVTDRRLSAASTDSDSSRHSSRGSRALSVSEQHFLFQAHQTLVQRISDLERALSARPRSRPQSCASDASSQSEPVSDEMLQLVVDLKAERDELKKDVDGWRNRVADSEKQMTLLFRRVENERREAWVARERASLMEAEKRSTEKNLLEKTVWGEEGWQKLQIAQEELKAVRQECDTLRMEAKQAAADREQIAQLKALLDMETRKREELEKDLEALLATPTPRAFEIHSKPMSGASRTMIFAKRGGLGFRSIDSVSSFTDVDSVGSVDHNKMNLKVVEEEDEEDSRDETMSECSTEDNGLTGYEDEEDNDQYAFHDSSSSSSLGSLNDFSSAATDGANDSADSVPPLSISRSSTASPAPVSTPPQQASHNRHKSLSRGWTFPQDNGSYDAPMAPVAEVDRFFNCLEDIDNSPPLASLESGKTLFSQALAGDDDELPPFVLPSGFGVEVQSPELESKTVLDVVQEEEEEDEGFNSGPDDEFVGQEVEGGIIFTFNPPPSFSDEPEIAQTPELLYDSSMSTPDSSFSEENSRSSSSTGSSPHISPSSIPRLAGSKKPLLPSFLPITSTPVKSSRAPESFQTPPAISGPLKRGTSPNEMRRSASPATPSKLPQPSFIRQPRRADAVKSTSPNPAPGKSPSSPKLFSSILDDTVSSQPSHASPEMSGSTGGSSPEPALCTPPSLTSMSPTLPSRISIQNLANLNPFSSLASWSSLSFKSPPSSSPSQNMPKAASVSQPPPSRFISREAQLEKLRLRLATEEENRHHGCFESSAIRNTKDFVMHL
ncbi:hypothetical protein BXZ70DRAFT_1075466 [Cristinia sonorae]|uniref:Uncharacterized protein n=1 Tax=Cristinia sonorae TaxID=1940300 RepID=A0A8K0UWM1_9AGAR|nr:hypothetical protein BXZ70DRAFT_1075466 [Cristinia sonorae]